MSQTLLLEHRLRFVGLDFRKLEQAAGLKQRLTDSVLKTTARHLRIPQKMLAVVLVLRFSDAKTESGPTQANTTAKEYEGPEPEPPSAVDVLSFVQLA